MNDPIQDPASVKPRTSLVTDAGTVKPGVGSLVAFALAGMLLAFAMTWAVIAVINKVHSIADDILIGGCLLAVVALVAPADLQKAVDVLKPVFPWTRDDHR